MTKPSGRGRYDRSQTTEERRGEHRERLLDAATEVFAARGYAGTRVDDIVEHAGISRRTLYEDFDSVDAILTEVQGIGEDFKGATTDLGTLRGEVESNLRKIEDLINDLNRKWPFHKEREIKVP